MVTQNLIMTIVPMRLEASGESEVKEHTINLRYLIPDISWNEARSLARVLSTVSSIAQVRIEDITRDAFVCGHNG